MSFAAQFAVQHGIPSFREFLLEAPSSIEEFRGVLTWGGGGGGFESHKVCQLSVRQHGWAGEPSAALGLQFKNAKEKTGFQTLGVRKAFMLLKIVQLGYNVLVSDVDTSWLQDPHPFFLSEPRARADTWLMSDCLSASMEERGLSCVTLTEFNTGVMYIRATNNSQVLMQSWLEELAATTNPNLHDQNVLNIAIQRQRCKPLQAGVDDAPGAPRSSRVVTVGVSSPTRYIASLRSERADGAARSDCCSWPAQPRGVLQWSQLLRAADESAPWDRSHPRPLHAPVQRPGGQASAPARLESLAGG
eukprot:scaffold518_cov388-Prasinococcus_capsulatus_cf.AAC.51